MEKALVNPLNFSVLTQGPGTAVTDLVIAGFFVYHSGEAPLIGGAKGLDDGLKGEVMKIRTDGRFSGQVGDSYFFPTPPDTIPAKNVLLIGLGEMKIFTLETVKTVGRLSLEKAVALSFQDVAFAPEVRDAGVTIFSAGEVAGAFVEGAMEAYEKMLSNGSTEIKMQSFKLLAGVVHEDSANSGMNAALNSFNSK